MAQIKDGWFSFVIPIDRNAETIAVYDVRNNLVLQGVGSYRWRPNHDPGDEDESHPLSLPLAEVGRGWVSIVTKEQ